MAEATKSPNRSPNGQAALRGGPVAARVAKLRERARTDSTGAREAAWDWMREDPLGHRAFEFTTYVESGTLDPEVEVLVIDYESVCTNPNLLIRQIRDELVQIVPGANLGKMLVKVPGRSLFGAAYFGLKSEL